MKWIRCFNDLAPYGIEALTGEACGLSYRILFDCTERGRKILAKCLGIPALELAEPWNPGSADDPHVGSIMLTQSMLQPVGIFALLESGCTECWLHKQGNLVGIEPADSPEEVARYREVYADQIARRFRYDGTAGDRNRHVFTGRVL